MNDLALFSIDEPRPVDPPKKTTVRAHERVVAPHARRTDPQTSHTAAKSITPGRVEERIMPVLEAEGPQTADEIAKRTGDHAPTVVSGLSRLKKAGRVVPTGERPSSRGRPSTVWGIA